jgi:hypothetical protein
VQLAEFFSSLPMVQMALAPMSIASGSADSSGQEDTLLKTLLRVKSMQAMVIICIA